MSPPTARLGPDKHSDTNKYKIDTQNSARNALLYLKLKVLNNILQKILYLSQSFACSLFTEIIK